MLPKIPQKVLNSILITKCIYYYQMMNVKLTLQNSKKSKNKKCKKKQQFENLGNNPQFN